ncbi:MAG: GAF domain-containing protein [Dehalococcoidia bacterium]
MRPSRGVTESSPERDNVLREVEQVLTLARSVSLGPQFDDIIRTAVEHATDRLMIATRRRTARLAALSAIQQTVAAGFDLPAIMAGVYEHVRQILDAPSFLVASVVSPPDTLRVDFAVADGRVAATPTTPLVATGLTAQVITSGQARIVNDLLADMPPARRRSAPTLDQGQPLRSALCVPMRKGDEVVGVIHAQSHRPGAYGPEDVEFVSTIAHQTAMALENARLYQDALSRRREVEALLDASQQLGADLDPEVVLRRVVEAAAHLVDAALATIGITTGPADTPGQNGTAAQSVGLRFTHVWQDGAWRRVGAIVTDESELLHACAAGAPLRDSVADGAAGALGGAIPPGAQPAGGAGAGQRPSCPRV